MMFAVICANPHKSTYMKNLLLSFAMLFASTFINAQSGNVGINTTTPQATLDVNGNLKVRTVQTITSATTDHTVLLRDKSVLGDFVLKEITVGNLLNSGGSGAAYSARKTGGWSLLTLSLGSSTYPINLSGGDTRVGNSALFTNGVYTAPVSGIYDVNFGIQLSGVDLTVLSGKSLVDLKNAAVWETKPFNGVRVQIGLFPAVTIPITSTDLHTLVQLNTGDTLTFGINTGGILPVNLGVLPISSTSLKVFKVSD